jgi:hypothetical protein
MKQNEYQQKAEKVALKEIEFIKSNFDISEAALSLIKLSLMSTYCKGAVDGIVEVQNVTNNQSVY